MNNNKIIRIYELGNMIELNIKDINSVLNDRLLIDEQLSLTAGPPPYNGGGFYGTISIKDFQ